MDSQHLRPSNTHIKPPHGNPNNIFLFTCFKTAFSSFDKTWSKVNKWKLFSGT